MSRILQTLYKHRFCVTPLGVETVEELSGDLGTNPELKFVDAEMTEFLLSTVLKGPIPQ